MPEKHQVTIKDIAREAGVSVATVSRALGDCWDVSAQTRELVLETARRMNYRPNPVAVNLKNRQTKTLGVVVPEFLNSFFPKIIIGMQPVLDEAGYRLFIMQCNELPETERSNLLLLEESRVDGIMLSVTRDGVNTDLYQRLLDRGIPLVMFNRISEQIRVPKVVIDDYGIAKAAVQHLIGQQCRRIVHFSGDERIKQTALRKQGYLDAMAEAALDEYAQVIPAGIYQEESYEMTRRMIERGELPDAVFCFNDPVAVGVILALQDHGIAIPEQVAVVGFSESRTAKILQLTSVEQPTEQMGRETARLMLQQIAAIDNPPRMKLPVETVCLEGRLNIRNSSLKHRE